MIKLILFDMGGVTHYDHRDRFLKKFCKTTGLDLKTLHKRCFPETWHQLDKGMISFPTAWSRIKKNIPYYDQLPSGFKEAGFKMDKNTGVVALVKQLKNTHRVGMLSNMSHSLYVRLKAKHFPFHLFRPLYLSYRMKMRKPEAQIFRTIAKQQGLAPSEILFIDDKQRNVKAAKKCGWKAIHFTSLTQLKKDLKKYL